MTVTTVEVGTYLSDVFPVDLPSGVYLNKVIVGSDYFFFRKSAYLQVLLVKISLYQKSQQLKCWCSCKFYHHPIHSCHKKYWAINNNLRLGRGQPLRTC